MTSTKPNSSKTTQADLDAALMSKLAYGSWDQMELLMATKDRPAASIRDALGPQEGQRPGESMLTEQQARYMDQRFEVVQVENFDDDIHAIALRDRKTGHVTVAIPGTDLDTLGDTRWPR